ncbi:MAG: MATE family efflux transporter [Oscillospiraceae bacterium]|nr:MATE family efflux transporter [Oscillospiraceae bacterium]
MAETVSYRDEKVKKITTTLDSLPFCTDDEIAQQLKNNTRRLPDGVTRRMILRDIFVIAWPAIIELALLTLASMVDLMMVGNLGPWAITAVGLASQPRMIFISIFQSLNVGATAYIARARGAEDRKLANSYLQQAMLFNFFFSIVLGVAGYVFSEQMIRAMGAPDAQTLYAGTQYIRVQCAGMLLYGVTMTISASLRGVGNTQTTMVYNVVANVVNIFANYLLIEGHLGFPRLEVLGASVATLIGQAAATVMAIIVIFRKRNYVFLEYRKGFRVRFDMIRDILVIGIPAMIEQLCLRFSAIMFNRWIAQLGTLEFAAHQVCMNIQMMSMTNGVGFAHSGTTLMGQSIGRRRPEMSQAYTRSCAAISLVVSVMLAILFFTCGGAMSRWYTDDPVVLERCAELFVVVAVIQPFLALQFTVAGSLRGAGDTKAVTIITFSTCVILRLILVYLAINVLHWGVVGAWWGMLGDQVTRAVLIWLRFTNGRWKKVFSRMIHRPDGPAPDAG